jgi:hypothetical protein
MHSHMNRYEPVVVWTSNSRSRYQPILEEQLKAESIPYYWNRVRNFSWKVRSEFRMEYCKDHPDTPIVFVDAWDTLFLGTRDELRDVVGPEKRLLHAQSTCYPHPEKASRYPEASSRWKYVNGGCIAGRGREILEAYEYGWKHFPILTDSHTEDDDQRFLTDVYLAGIGKLDSDCRLNWCVYDLKPGELKITADLQRGTYNSHGGRVINTVTGSTPLFIHMAGHSPLIQGLF